MNKALSPGPIRLRVALLLCCGFCVALQFGRTPASLPLLREQFGFGLAVAGWLVSSVSLLAAFTGLSAGILAARIGAQRAVMIGLGLAASGCLVGLMAQSPAGLIAARVIEGAGFIITVTAVPPLLMRIAAPATAPGVMAIWGTYLPAGMALMLAISPALLGLGGWRLPLGVNLGLLLVMLAAFVAVFGGDDGTTAQSSAPAVAIIRALVGHRTPLLLGLVFLLYAAQFLSIMAFLPLIFSEGGWSASLAMMVTAGIVALNAAGNVLGGLLVRRGIDRVAILVGATIAMGIAGATALLPDLPTPARVVAAAIMSFCGGPVPATLLATVPQLDLTPAGRATCVGLLLQCAGIGQLLGPPLFGAVASAAGWGGAAAVAGLLAAGAVLCAAHTGTRR